MNNDSKVAHVTVASNAEYLNISNQDSMNKLNENGLRLLDSNNYRTKSTIFIGKVSNVINVVEIGLVSLIHCVIYPYLFNKNKCTKMCFCLNECFYDKLFKLFLVKTLTVPHIK